MTSFLTEIHRPVVPQETLDDAACVVLAYCVASAFLTKNQGVPVMPSHFIRMLSYLREGRSTINFTNMESAHNTYDQITLRAPASEATRNYILTKLSDRMSPDFCMVRSILDYLNNDSDFGAMVETVTNNGVMNRIIIDVDNMSVGEPKATSIMIDNEHVKLFNTVMPIYDHRTGIGGVGQKELEKDYGFETQRQFVLSNLGVDVGPDSAVYYQTAHNDGSPSVASVELATRGLYNNVCRKINDGLAGANDTALYDFRMQLIAKMLGCCYGVTPKTGLDLHDVSDCTCLVIPSNKIKHKSFAVNPLVDKLYNCDLLATCPENVNPSIRIMDGKTELFQVRFKKERYSGNLTDHRYKMYFKPSRLEEYF
jgi:hypothetical protein